MPFIKRITQPAHLSRCICDDIQLKSILKGQKQRYNNNNECQNIKLSSIYEYIMNVEF